MVGAFLVKKGRSGKYWYLFGQGFGLLIDGFDLSLIHISEPTRPH